MVIFIIISNLDLLTKLYIFNYYQKISHLWNHFKLCIEYRCQFGRIMYYAFMTFALNYLLTSIEL